MNEKPSRPIVNDITASKSKAPSNTELIKTEMENGIPVKQPTQPQTSPAKNSNPIASSKHFIDEEPAKKDTELEKILQDVNKNVKEVGSKPNSKFKLFARDKKTSKKSDSKQLSVKKQPKPILAIIAAATVAIALSVAAVYAFRKGQQTASVKTKANIAKSVTTSADSLQNSGDTLVTAADLSKISISINSKLDTLDDSKDFNDSDLSDQNLGL